MLKRLEPSKRKESSRYDIETIEMVELDYKLETHNTIYSIGERVFVWDYGECDI